MEMNEYLAKYPWLKGYDPYPEDNDPCCILEWLPKGWVEAFGEIMCEDLDRIIKAENLQDEFRIDEAKEKYGQIRLYCHPCTPAIQDVIRTYEAISETACCHCGTVEGVKMTNFGWVEPLCKPCCSKINRAMDSSKFDALPNEELPTVVKWSRFSQSGTERFEMDISETTKRIRERYEERKANGEFDESNDFEGDDDYYGA